MRNVSAIKFNLTARLQYLQAAALGLFLGLCHVGGGSNKLLSSMSNRPRQGRLRGRLNVSGSIKRGSLQLAWNGKLILVDGAVLSTPHSSQGSSTGAVKLYSIFCRIYYSVAAPSLYTFVLLVDTGAKKKSLRFSHTQADSCKDGRPIYQLLVPPRNQILQMIYSYITTVRSVYLLCQIKFVKRVLLIYKMFEIAPTCLHRMLWVIFIT